MAWDVGGLDNKLVLGQNQGEPPHELHYVQTMQLFFVNDVFNSTVVGVDGNDLLGPFMPPKNADGGGRSER